MVKLIIDSPAYASKNYVSENNIQVVSLSYTLNGVTKQEGYEEICEYFF